MFLLFLFYEVGKELLFKLRYLANHSFPGQQITDNAPAPRSSPSSIKTRSEDTSDKSTVPLFDTLPPPRFQQVSRSRDNPSTRFQNESIEEGRERNFPRFYFPTNPFPTLICQPW